MAKLTKTFAKFGYYLHDFEDNGQGTSQFLFVSYTYF